MKHYSTFCLVLLLTFLITSAGFGAVHTIANAGSTFSPNTISIFAGDTVVFTLATLHNAVEVAQSTWNANGTTALPGGFSVPFGGGTTVLNAIGTHYFVCSNHGAFGMKGIITVSAAPPPPNTITLNSIADQDGQANTSTDRIGKNWSLKLYHGSTPAGAAIDSVISGQTVTVHNLPAGTYLAVEADSNYWSHISVIIDGVPQGSTVVNQWVFTVTSGELHTIDFINSAPHIVMNAGFAFLPDSLTMSQGDTVRFVLEPMHSAREVSQSTWLANDTVANGGFDLPFGGGSAILVSPGVHYYVCLAHASAGMKGRIFVAPPPSNISVDDSLLAGWNLISLPVTVSDGRISTIVPTAVSSAFSFHGSYQPQTQLLTGPGYWLKMNGPEKVSFIGLPVVRESLAVENGWNMIGSSSVPIAVAGMTTNPPSIINSQIFGYNGSYFPADTIRPGSGYWVRMNQAGTLVLDSAAGHNQKIAAQIPAADVAMKLTVRDNQNRSSSLKLLRSGAAIAGSSVGQTNTLPPLPPEGGFDVRFASNSQSALIDQRNAREHMIEITGAVYPVTIRWDVTRGSDNFILRLGGKEIAVSGSGEIRAAEPVRSLSLIAPNGRTLPAAYSLAPAYPNPFNPSTTIGFTLPVESHVRLNVYNIIGQMVASLIDGTMPAGTHAVEWTPKENASGVFLVRFDAAATTAPGTAYSRVAKVVLQK
jgi:plastocyanin